MVFIHSAKSSRIAYKYSSELLNGRYERASNRTAFAIVIDVDAGFGYYTQTHTRLHYEPNELCAAVFSLYLSAARFEYYFRFFVDVTSLRFV